MKTIVSALILLIAFGFGANAQEKQSKTPEQKAEALTQKLTKMLTLTPDQVVKVRAINLDRYKKLAAAKSEYKSDEKNKDAKQKQIKKDWEASLKAILTPQQQATYNQKKEEKKLDKKKGDQKDGKDKKKDDDDDM